RERLGGDPQEVAAEAAPASAMTDGRTAVELAMAEAERIIDLPAVVQNATLLHPLHDRGAADHRVLEVARPPREVADRREDRARPHRRRVVDQPPVPAIRERLVRFGAVAHDPAVVIL